MADESFDGMAAIVGVDRARRIGWARYFQEREATVKLLKVNLALQERLAQLAILIAFNETVGIMDPDGELCKQAIATIAALRRNPRGQAALDKAREKHHGRQ